ncbi:MAG: Eco57I restriction-modification methylase domain-containing protein, partial [Bacteroidales bacterium]|nr:Eco57I restriction-modification methylase domain-containing protein [Bacteroidales bacterium]
AQSPGIILDSGNQITGSADNSEDDRTGSRAASVTLDAKLRDLLSYSDHPNPFDRRETEVLIHAIDNIKILDPACGSGAFPMGILHKLVHILHRIDPRNEQWQRRQLEKVDRLIVEAEEIPDTRTREEVIAGLEETRQGVIDAFENNELDYGRKLFLIENCIYGVDIQPIAVQIAKLRFFISLIVDQKVSPASFPVEKVAPASSRRGIQPASEPEDNVLPATSTRSAKPNLGLRPLPNLETKFVAANTLISLEKDKANLFTNPDIEKKKARLKKVRHEYFEARTPRSKDNCRQRDRQLRDELAGLLVLNHELQPDTAKILAQWDPYDQNSSAGWFDPEWMFGVSGGFDVVIGNPPYKVANKSEKKLYKNYITFIIGEFYAYFFEKTIIDHLKEKGIISFITASLYVKGIKFDSLRKFLEKNIIITALRTEGDKVFENVQMPTSILIGIKVPKVDGSWNFEDLIPNNYLVKKIDKDSNLLMNFSNIMRGFEIGRNLVKYSGEIQFITGSDIRKWIINKYRYISKSVENEFMKDEEYFNGERVYLRETGSELVSIFLNKKLYCNRSIYSIKIIDNNYSAKYLTSLLNSRLFQFYYKSKFRNETDIFPKIRIAQVKQLPIKKITKSKTYDIIVDYLIIQKRSLFEYSFFERLIDAMVYELYFPEAIQAAGCEVLRHLEHLPELRENWSDEQKLQVINKVQMELSDPKHPVTIAMKTMESVEEVAIIEGRR